MEESYDFSLGCPSSTSTTLERYQIEQMSRFCLNGSLSHLSTDQWKDLCLPYYKDEVGFDKIAGTFGVLTFIVGVIGNSFTLFAVPFAKYKHRHDFHRSFWTTDIWIVHLAFCDIIWCVLTLPYCFLIPSFGSHNYPQLYGSDAFCRSSFIIGYATMGLDWLLMAIIAMTRAIKIKFPDNWKTFCGHKGYVLLSLAFPWLLSFGILSPLFLQPSLEFGYNCRVGKCTVIPTGKDSLDVFLDEPWMLNVLPWTTAFLIPFSIIVVSYLVIWQHIQSVKTNRVQMTNIKSNEKNKISSTEMKFIWTILIVCIFYLLCSGTLTTTRFLRLAGKDGPHIVFVTNTAILVQYCINFFVYAYRSKQYRAAYWDVLAAIFPSLAKRKEFKEKIGVQTTGKYTGKHSNSNTSQLATPKPSPKPPTKLLNN